MCLMTLIVELSNEDELEQLKAAIDFLVELCETVSPVRLQDCLVLLFFYFMLDLLAQCLYIYF